MKRIDKIYEYIKQASEGFSAEGIKENGGFSASEISESLDILRNNVSQELNNLFRTGKIVKIKGRPVLYFSREKLEEIIGRSLREEELEIENVETLFSRKQEKRGVPFDRLIGAESSLKNQIEQAKAAVLYPPNGLHTLILGQTGVGKTLFANMMYSYAKFAGRLKEDAPFVVFNCADYYNNPHLLISHIFGHIKGAFTGADSEKSGIVEKADGGILFLDEIHRLPPEGQEMIFYFMDTGTFNKLGETERKRRANVLIVGATTEDPNSSLLKTFIRRIPIIINIPSLDERSINEKFDIIKHLFSLEAHRVNKPIKISAEVIKALIGSLTYGNIGQLKSNIQLICAKGFLNSIDNSEVIEIEFKLLPQNIKDGLFSIGNKRKELEKIADQLSKPIIVKPDGCTEISEEDDYEPPYNLYKIIEDKANILKEEGMDEDYIRKFITTDINIHIKSFYDKFKGEGNSRERILKIVEEDILEFAEKIQKLAEKRLGRKYNERFLYALSLHLSAFLNRIKENDPLDYADLDEIIRDKPEEYKAAIEIKALIEEKYSVTVTDMEIIYLALLLSSVNDNNTGHVGIIVAAHGSSTASSMVNVATKLLGEGDISAIDMPLEVSPKEILEKVIEKVVEIDRGKGVLLLVDMGSLANFEDTIKERTSIDVKTIDMVSTPLVLEAVRKANIFDMNLESIYSSLKDFRGYGTGYEKQEDTDRVIVTVCSTGKGTAEKLRELVEEIISNIASESIRVIPVGIRDLTEEIQKIKDKHNIIAAVGVVNPDTAVPFISLESLIDGTGEKYLKTLISGHESERNDIYENVVVKNLCEDSLKNFLTFLNPYKITDVLLNFISVLEQEMNTKFSNSMSIRVMIHTACALERMVLHDGLEYRYDRNNLNKDILMAIKKASSIFENTLNLILSEDEMLFITEMFS